MKMGMDVDSNAFDNNNEDDNTTVENNITPTTPTPSLFKEDIIITISNTKNKNKNKDDDNNEEDVNNDPSDLLVNNISSLVKKTIKHLHRIHPPLQIHHRHLILFKISIIMIIIIRQQQQYIILPLQLCIERIIMAQELIIHLLPPPIRILLHHSISIIIITIPTIITITLMHHVYHVHYHPTQDQS